MVARADGNGKEVIFAHEHSGQLEGCCHIERLVEGAAVCGAVTEEAHSHPAVALILACEGGSGSDGDSRADDAVCTEYALVSVGDVH